MEIQIDRKLVIAVIVIVALAIGAVVLWPLTDTVTGSPSTLEALAPAPTQPAAGSPEQVAVEFIQAFYTADYRDPEGWLTNLESLSTTDGYNLLKSSFGPVLWPKLTEAQTVTLANQVKAKDQGLLAEGVSKIGGPWQVRKVTVVVEPSALWPTMKTPTFSANVLLAQQEGGTWRFVSFLNDEDIQKLKKGASDS